MAVRTSRLRKWREKVGGETFAFFSTLISFLVTFFFIYAATANRKANFVVELAIPYVFLDDSAQVLPRVVKQPSSCPADADIITLSLVKQEQLNKSDVTASKTAFTRISPNSSYKLFFVTAEYEKDATEIDWNTYTDDFIVGLSSTQMKNSTMALAGLEWFIEHCNTEQSLVITHFPKELNMTSIIENHKTRQNKRWLECLKNKLPQETGNPESCDDGGYFMSYPNAKRIYEESKTTKLHRDPDIAISGILRAKSGIKLTTRAKLTKLRGRHSIVSLESLPSENQSAISS